MVCRRCCVSRGVRPRSSPMSVKQRAERRISRLKAMLESETSLRLKPHLYGKLERRVRHEAALERCEYIVNRSEFKRQVKEEGDVAVHSKVSPGCAHLDLKEVERVLVRHRANIGEAAKELGVSRTDLRKLTWHNPKILEEALFWCDVYVGRCYGVMIEALHSKSRRRREWGADKILSSSMAYGNPFASARWAPSARRQLGIYTGQARAQREAAAELEADRQREIVGERVDIEPLRNFGVAPPAQVSLWPAGIRRPSRGGRWR